MKTLLSLALLLMIGSMALAVMPVEIRDYGTPVSTSIVTVPAGIRTTINAVINGHAWMVQNLSGTDVFVWFVKNEVTDNYGFKLKPDMIIGDSGNPRLFAWSSATANIAFYKRVGDR